MVPFWIWQLHLAPMLDRVVCGIYIEVSDTKLSNISSDLCSNFPAKVNAILRCKIFLLNSGTERLWYSVQQISFRYPFPFVNVRDRISIKGNSYICCSTYTWRYLQNCIADGLGRSLYGALWLMLSSILELHSLLMKNGCKSRRVFPLILLSNMSPWSSR